MIHVGSGSFLPRTTAILTLFRFCLFTILFSHSVGGNCRTIMRSIAQMDWRQFNITQITAVLIVVCGDIIAEREEAQLSVRRFVQCT